jgi:O-antigen/teichoic acid export membrane protein
MISSLVDAGLTELCGRFIPEIASAGDSTEIQRFSSKILAFRMAAAAVFSAFLFPIFHFLYGDRFPVTYFAMIVVILLITNLSSVSSSILFGLNKMGKYSLRDPLRRFLSLVFILILFHYYGVFGALLSFFLVEALLAAINLCWTRKYFRLESFNIDLPYLSPYLKISFIFYIATSVFTIWLRLGNPLIEYLSHDLRQVAIFDISNQIFLITLSFVSFFINSLIPIFTELYLNNKHDKLSKWSILLVKYISMPLVIVIGVLSLVGQEVMVKVIGSEYGSISYNSVMLLLGLFPMIIAQVGYVYAMIYKKPKPYLKSLIYALFSFGLLSILLIPKLASFGCSISIVVSCFVFALSLSLYFKNEIAPCVFELCKTVIWSIVLVPFHFLHSGTPMALFWSICFILSYTTLLFISRTLKPYEIEEIFLALGWHRNSKIVPSTAMPARE